MFKTSLILAAAIALPISALAEQDTLEVDDFNKISYSVPYEVELVASDEPFVKLEGDEDTIDKLEIEVSGDTLKITKEESWFDWSDDGDVSITIGYTDLEEMRLAGSGDAFAEELNVDDFELKIAGSANFETQSLTCNDLEIAIAGSGNVELHNVEADQVSTSIAGSGDVEMAGEVVEQTVSIAGSGDVNARDLRSQEATVSVRGSGDVEVWVAAALTASVVGSGDIVYYGKPSVDRNVAGSGNITHRGDAP